MIEEIHPFLPLKISTVKISDDSQLQISGEGWNFTTIGAWRITENENMLLGCFDFKSENALELLKDKIIIEVGFQDTRLKLDPIFKLSNNHVLEIFSMDTIEPWTFRLIPLGTFVGTPNESNAFMKK